MKDTIQIRPLIHNHFLLQSEYVKIVYRSRVKKMPIIDYNNHFVLEQLTMDTIFDSITQTGLEGDHYKYCD